MTHGSPLDVYSIEMRTHIHMKPRMLMSTAASLAIITPWTQAQRPPVGGWMNVLGFSPVQYSPVQYSTAQYNGMVSGHGKEQC